MIRRLCVQRDCLALSASMISELSGPVLELGLGNGRTFDHLRHLMPGREIFVFESVILEEILTAPDPEFLIEGDVRETLPAYVNMAAQKAVLIHNDIDEIGGSTAEQQRALFSWLSPLIRDAAAPSAVIVSNSQLDFEDWHRIQLPAGHAPDRYFMYQRPLESDLS